MTPDELAARLHQEIMNLPCDESAFGTPSDPATSFKWGHSFAISAAAELAQAMVAEALAPALSLEGFVRHLLARDAVHRDGTVLSKATWDTVFAHLESEVAELGLGLARGDRDNVLEEFGDVLGVVVHGIIKVGSTMAEVESLEIDKLKQRVTIPADDVEQVSKTEAEAWADAGPKAVDDMLAQPSEAGERELPDEWLIESRAMDVELQAGREFRSRIVARALELARARKSMSHSGASILIQVEDVQAAIDELAPPAEVERLRERADAINKECDEWLEKYNGAMGEVSRLVETNVDLESALAAANERADQAEADRRGVYDALRPIFPGVRLTGDSPATDRAKQAAEAIARMQAALAAANERAERAEAERDRAQAECAAVHAGLEWTGDGYEWNPKEGDYRERPADAIGRHARKLLARLAALEPKGEGNG